MKKFTAPPIPIDLKREEPKIVDYLYKLIQAIRAWEVDVSGSSTGVTDHGLLTGLADDDHTHYHNDTRGDVRYYTKTLHDAATSTPHVSAAEKSTWNGKATVETTGTPAPVAATGVLGTDVDAAHSDHVHAGLHSTFNHVPNASFDEGLRGWSLTGAGATLAPDTTNQKLGQVCAALTRSGTNCAVYQDIFSPLGAGFWQSRQVTLGCFVKASVANRAFIRINDGVANYDSSYHTGGGAYEFLTVTATLNAAATALSVRGHVADGDTTAYFDGFILVAGPFLLTFAPNPDDLKRLALGTHMIFETHFCGGILEAGMVSYAGGTGAAAALLDQRSGVVGLQSGTAAAAYASVCVGTSLIRNFMPSTNVLIAEALIRVATAGHANVYHAFGFATTMIGLAQGGVDRAVFTNQAGGSWFCGTQNGAAVNWSGLLSASTDWHILRIELTSTVAYFYLDHALVFTSSTALPNEYMTIGATALSGAATSPEGVLEIDAIRWIVPVV